MLWVDRCELISLHLDEKAVSPDVAKTPNTLCAASKVDGITTKSVLVDSSYIFTHIFASPEVEVSP